MKARSKLALSVALITSFSTPAIGQYPDGTITLWPISGTICVNPNSSVADTIGVTKQVATSANPLTVATVIENTCHPGGPCGVIYWNPANNFFKWYGFGSGFQSGIDLNQSSPTKTDGLGKTFGPGDAWLAKTGCPTFLMQFAGSDNFRSYGTDGTVGTQVDQLTGNVWLTETTGKVARLDPATNELRQWYLGGAPHYVAVDNLSRAYATIGCNNEIVRIDPATNSVTHWAVPTASGLLCGGQFGNPDGITVDSDGRIWFAEAAGNKIGRLDPTTNMICEFAKSEISNPQLVASSGTGALLQTFFSENSTGVPPLSGNAVSLVTQVEADKLPAGPNKTCATVPPTSASVAPAISVVTFTDFTEQDGKTGCPCGSCRSPLTATIAPSSFTVPGNDGVPSGTTLTASGKPIPAMLRFPMPGGANGASGMTQVASANTVFGSTINSSHLWRLNSEAIIAKIAPRLSGEAYTAAASVNIPPGLTVPKIAQAVLPPGGGSDTNSIVSVSIPPPSVPVAIGVGVGKNSTSGSADPSAATSTATSLTSGVTLDLTSLGGPKITAEELKAVATCSFSQPGTVASASNSPEGTQFAGLVVANPSAVVPDPVPPNFTIAVPPVGSPVGSIILDEQVSGGNGATTTQLTVNMIHVKLAKSLGSPVDVDVVVGSAHCDINGTGVAKEVVCCQQIDVTNRAPMCSVESQEQCVKGGGVPIVGGSCDSAKGQCVPPPPPAPPTPPVSLPTPPAAGNCCQFASPSSSFCSSLPPQSCQTAGGVPVPGGVCDGTTGRCEPPSCCQFHSVYWGFVSDTCSQQLPQQCMQMGGDPAIGDTCDSATGKCVSHLPAPPPTPTAPKPIPTLPPSPAPLPTTPPPPICCQFSSFFGLSCAQELPDRCQQSGGNVFLAATCDPSGRCKSSLPQSTPLPIPSAPPLP